MLIRALAKNQIILSMLSRQRGQPDVFYLPGGYSGTPPLDPIPNSTVKRSSANGTTLWESRSLPGILRTSVSPLGCVLGFDRWCLDFGRSVIDLAAGLDRIEPEMGYVAEH